MLSQTEHWREPASRSTAYEAGGVHKSYYDWEDDQGLEEIHDETFMIIGLLTTESPTFGAE